MRAAVRQLRDVHRVQHGVAARSRRRAAGLLQSVPGDRPRPDQAVHDGRQDLPGRIPMAGTRSNCQNCHRRAAYPAFDPKAPASADFGHVYNDGYRSPDDPYFARLVEDRLHVVDRAQERGAVSGRGPAAARRRCYARRLNSRRKCRR